MKKEYLSPEFELNIFSFESILTGTTLPVIVSDNESGGNDNDDSDVSEW